MERINKSEVPRVLLRTYEDSGSTLSLNGFIDHHYKLYRESLDPRSPYKSLAQWVDQYRPSSHRYPAVITGGKGHEH